jgi:glycosyltransferase involved in cell wall biosynthesis
LKILHVNYSDKKGGAAISVKRLHDLLIKKNQESYLIVGDKNYQQKDIITHPTNLEKIKYIFKESFNRKISKIFYSNKNTTISLNILPSKILKIINRMNADIVNLHWIGNETLSLFDINKINTKIVWTLHDMWPFLGTDHYSSTADYSNGFKDKKINNYYFNLDRFIWKLKKKNFNNVKKIICTSKWMYDKVNQSDLFNKKEIKIIELPIDQEFWKPLDKNISKKFLNIDSTKKVIVFGADNFLNNNRKGFSLFIEIIKYLKKTNKFEFEVILFGETKNLDQFKHMNFINMGYINDDITKKLIYSAADVTVVPSVLEAFGLVAQEATHCGSPCVVFNNTGLTSIIEHKKNGYISNYNSINDMCEGVNWCLKEMNGKENDIHLFTKQKFDIDKIIRKYLNFIND